MLITATSPKMLIRDSPHWATIFRSAVPGSSPMDVYYSVCIALIFAGRGGAARLILTAPVLYIVFAIWLMLD